MLAHDHTNDFVSVSVAGLILIRVADRTKFNAIELPVRNHGIQPDGLHLLTKRVEQSSVVVVFLHWLTRQPEVHGVDTSAVQHSTEATKANANASTRASQASSLAASLVSSARASSS